MYTSNTTQHKWIRLQKEKVILYIIHNIYNLHNGRMIGRDIIWK